MLGPPAESGWRKRDLSAERPVGRVSGCYDREGAGAFVLGDPRIALSWLANELSALGIPLRAGQVVTTGTCLKPLENSSRRPSHGRFRPSRLCCGRGQG